MNNSIELFGCAMETDAIYGLHWPNTKTGELAIVKCSVFSVTNNNAATRLCNNNNIWDKIDVSNCESEKFSILLSEVHILNYVVSTLIKLFNKIITVILH